MAKMYYNGDANAELLNGKTVAVIGFGSQGHAHSLNMKESGVNVIVGLRKGRSWDAAVEAGLEVYTVAEAVAKADIVHDLTSRRKTSKSL